MRVKLLKYTKASKKSTKLQIRKYTEESPEIHPTIKDAISKKLELSNDLMNNKKYKCPISKNLMQNAYVCNDGITYDQSYIRLWLNDHKDISPLGVKITVMMPNYRLNYRISSKKREIAKLENFIKDNRFTVEIEC